MPFSRLTEVLRALEDRTEELQKPGALFCFGKEKQFQLSIAKDIEDRKKAYALVYKNYLDKGFIEPHDSKMWFCLHDAHPDTLTMIVKEKDRVVGAITVIYDSLMGPPCEELYPKEIDSLRADFRYPGEVVSLGVEKEIRGATEVLSKLIEFSFLYSRKIRKATDYAITVNPKHIAFYKQKLLFKDFGPQKTYEKVGGAPAVLLRLDLAVYENTVRYFHEGCIKDPNKLRTLYKCFSPENESSACLAYLRNNNSSMNEKELYYFFVKSRPLLEKANPKTLSYLNELLGEHPIKNIIETLNTAERHSHV